MRPDDKPACAGKWMLFDSRHPNDHLEARQLCMACPVRTECNTLLKQTLADYPTHTGEHGPEGTWAGRHLNPKKRVGRPVKGAA